MALHPSFPASPHEVLHPEHRWFPAAEELRSTAYDEAASTLARNFLLIAPDLIVLDRLRADFDGLRIFLNDPVLPDNGDDFQGALHIQDDVRIVRPTGNIFLTDIHRVYLGDPPEPSLDDEDLRDYFPAPFGDKPVGKTNDSNIDLGELVREMDELAVFNDEAGFQAPASAAAHAGTRVPLSPAGLPPRAVRGSARNTPAPE